MKAAGHELKGLMCWYNCQKKELNVPLMTIIDYRGFRVVAMSLLPINKDKTLIYGSNNCGDIVHNSDEEFSKHIEKAAQTLNLKKHLAGGSVQQSIYGPADIEGHKSDVDGLYYLLDFARTMPPQMYVRQEGGKRHLFELLRPELVKSNHCPLSSDALTNMGRRDPEQMQNNYDVINCCKRLFKEVIPKFCEDIELEYARSSKSESAITFISSISNEKVHIKYTTLITKLHRAGINIRHLGFVRRLIKAEKIRETLLIEMIARALKDVIQDNLRSTMKLIKVPSEEPYRAMVLNFLNYIFINDRESYWCQKMKRILMSKFILPFSEPELDEACNLLELVDVGELLTRFQQISNIYLVPDAVEVLTIGSSLLVDSDLLHLASGVKNMNIIPEAAAMVLSFEAKQRCGTEALRLYQQSLVRFQEAMAISPNSRFAYYESGKLLHHIAVNVVKRKSDALRLLAASIEKLERCIQIDDEFHEGRVHLANALIDFAINKTRLTNVFDNMEKDPGLVYEIEGFLKKSGEHFQIALDADESLDEVVMQFLEVSSEKKLVGFFGASIYAGSLYPLLVDVCKSVSVIHVENSVYIGWSSMLALGDAVSHLVHLGLKKVILNNQTFKELGAKLPNLESLDITGCQGITVWPNTITASLRRLVLDHIEFEDAVYHYLMRQHHGLEAISLYKTNISDEMISLMFEWISGLKSLEIGRSYVENAAILPKVQKINFTGFSLQICDFSGCINIANSTVLNLSRNMPNLNSLSLAGCTRIEDYPIHNLTKKCRNLTDLNLSNTSIGDGSLKKLCTNIVRLNVSGTPMKGTKLIEWLKKLPYLNELDISDWKKLESDPWLSISKARHSEGRNPRKNFSRQKSSASIKSYKISSNFTSPLRKLIIRNWSLLTDQTVSVILKKCPELNFLDISHCRNVTDRAIVTVASFRRYVMKGLIVSGLNLTDIAITKLSEKCLNLEELDISYCRYLTKESILNIGDGLTSLRILNCSNTSATTNEGVQYILHRNHNLEELEILGCNQVTSEFLSYRLRHQSPHLNIKMEKVKKLPILEAY
eukprot:TRINITY_DN6230_c0_g1_i1.p1 TRINITY_DN6230_c0_g1~~TRINITY_DN6230_c0_g1_i1.p1  ORF type:complete len:1223 (-),score=269.02 TRINITY_DN6230_c0_g1_i1:80-3244(-)